MRLLPRRPQGAAEGRGPGGADTYSPCLSDRSARWSAYWSGQPPEANFLDAARLLPLQGTAARRWLRPMRLHSVAVVGRCSRQRVVATTKNSPVPPPASQQLGEPHSRIKFVWRLQSAGLSNHVQGDTPRVLVKCDRDTQVASRLSSKAAKAASRQQAAIAAPVKPSLAVASLSRHTSGATGIPRVWTPKMAALPARSGGGTCSSLQPTKVLFWNTNREPGVCAPSACDDACSSSAPVTCQTSRGAAKQRPSSRGGWWRQ